MKTANYKMFSEMVDKKGKNGLAKFALQCGVSMTIIHYCRQGIAPSQKLIDKICKSLKLPESKLFPESEV